MTSVFQKFGGFRPMSAKLGGVPTSTIKSWHSNGRIPAWRHALILQAAERHGIALTAGELVNLTPDDPEETEAIVHDAPTPVTRNPDAGFRP